MRKILSKIAGTLLGLSLALGVGVAVSSSKLVETKADESVFDFSNGTNSSSSNTWTSDYLTIVQTQGTGSDTVGNYISAPRWYTNHSIVFTPASGVTLTKLEFTFSRGGAGNWSSGSYSSNTWTGSVSGSDLTLTPTAQARPTSLTVTYTSDGGGGSGGGGGSTPGTADLPYTVAQARAAIDASSGTSGAYATGIVKAIPYAWTSSNGITFNMVDNVGDTNFLQAYKCKNTETVALNTIVVGDTVTVRGNLKKYNSTYEFDTGCTLVSLTHPAPATEFTVTYNSNGGSGTMTDATEYASGASVTVLANTFTAPSSLVEFKEFNTKRDGTGNSYSAGNTFNITENVTLYAIWQVKAATLDDGTYTSVLSYSNPISNLVDVKIGETPYTYLSTTSSGLTYDDSNSSFKLSPDGSIELINNSNAKITKAVLNVYKFNNFDLYEDGSSTYTYHGTGSQVGSGNVDIEIDTNASSKIKVVCNGGTGTYNQSIASITLTLLVGEAPVDVLNGISVSGAKTDFTIGEDFVTTGLVVTAHYETAGDQVISTGYTVDDSEVDKTQAGTYTVTVSFETASDTYDVTYSAPTPVELSTYKKVKTNLADYSGKYLIVCEEEGALFAFDGSLTTLDATSNTQPITISNEIISLSSEYEFTIASKEDGYSIKSSSNLYIGQTSDGNGLKSSATDDYTNSISFNGTSMDIVSGGAYMRYNASSGQDRFRYFKSSTYSSQKAIALYQKVDAADALALDLLNETYGVCSQSYDNQKSDFEEIWSTLGTAFNALTPELQSKLVGVQADKEGVMIKESMARYDLITGKYELNNFITGRTPILASGSIAYLPATDTNSSTIIVVIVAITSITSIGVLLVIKRRRSLVK